MSYLLCPPGVRTYETRPSSGHWLRQWPDEHPVFFQLPLMDVCAYSKRLLECMSIFALLQLAPLSHRSGRARGLA